MRPAHWSTANFFVVCAAIIISVVPLRASTFGFNDEYYVSSLSQFHSTFGASASGYSSPGIYQETNSVTPIITRIGSGSSSAVPGEYVQNTTPNLNQELVLNGWGQSLNNGQQVANVYNLQNPQSGADLYFKYDVAGSATSFNFNSIDLRGSSPTANLSFTLEGLDASNDILYSAILNVVGNTFTTETLNWAGVTTVEFASTASLPVNWNLASLYMDNVTINDPLPAVPEPSSLTFLGLGLLVLGLVYRNREPQASLIAK
jgi:hypothetical protein